MTKCKMIMALFSVCILIIIHGTVFAFEADGDDEEYESSSSGDYDDEIRNSMDQFDFSGIDDVLNGVDKASDISFSSMVTMLIEGRFNDFMSEMGKYIFDRLTLEIRVNKNVLWQIIAISAISALFTNFAQAFDNGQAGETGFFVSYLVMASLMMTAFLSVYIVAETTIKIVVEFVMALVPAFYLAVVFTGKSMASMAFYELTVTAAGVVEWLFLKFLLPALKVYIAFVTANNMTKEGQLGKLTELIAKAVKWTAKSLFGIVIGISVIQNMVLPYADSVKTNLLTKTLSSMPGIGSAIDSAAGLVLGTANLIKNGIGTAALIFITVICFFPVIKIFIIQILSQAAAAMVQPIADKRITDAVSQYADGMKALLMLVFYTAALFMIIIAMVCAFTVPDV